MTLVIGYLLTTGIKGTASMKLHRDLNVTQKTAWHLAHRIREVWAEQSPPFNGSGVEVDEAYFGGKNKNRHPDKRIPGRGTAGKAIVAAARDRDTGQIAAEVVPATRKHVLRQFVADHVEPGTPIYTDELPSYRGLPNHYTVNHGVGEYVSDMAHVNGVESFWALLKRGYYGTYHRISPAHLKRYAAEFAGRSNMRSLDTILQMTLMVQLAVGRRLRYKDLAVGRKAGAKRVAT